ncbi:MAG: pyridoxal-phosphate dependent enzyme [Anaerolineae bacterium]|nr:pyridoxal-phosphate dependent enzyme [Anaerolineae bacterium]
MWKYKSSLGFADGYQPVMLGEGATPLIWVNKLDRKIGLKLESQNPTGSYKDRGSAALVNYLAWRGITKTVEDSSGNAGASFAAYAARAGISAHIYIPANTRGPKREQIAMFGAHIVEVAGPRSAAAKAVIEAARDEVAYASHAYLPFGLPGIATIAYEIWQTCEGVGSIVAPVGHGGLLYGIIKGFEALEAGKYIQRSPYMVGVQAQACSPAVAMYYGGEPGAEESCLQTTVADGVRIVNPTRARKIIEWMGRDRGHFVAVKEADIHKALSELSHMGVYIEPTAALAWAALGELIGKIPEPIMLILSGSGLKYH